MAPVVTAAYETDPVNFLDPTNQSGPLVRNGNVYDVLGAPAVVARVQRSTDQGVTWVTWGGAGVAGVPLSGARFYWNAASPTATFLCVQGGSVCLLDFDLDSGTWGTIYGTVGGPASAAIASLPAMTRRSNGDVVMIYCRQDAGTPNPNLLMSIYSAGSATWTAVDVTIDTHAGALPSPFVPFHPINFGSPGVDSSDTSHFVYAGVDTSSVSNSLFYINVNAAGTASTPFQFPTIDNPSPGAFKLALYGSTLYLAFGGAAQATSGPFSGGGIFLLSTPVSSPTSWAAVGTVVTLDPSITKLFPVPVVTAAGALFVVWCLLVNDPYGFGFGAQITQVWYSRFQAGAWQSPVLYYDLAANCADILTTPLDPVDTPDISILTGVLPSSFGLTGFGVLISVRDLSVQNPPFDVFLKEPPPPAANLVLGLKGMKVYRIPPFDPLPR